jgi:hypothetical protein
MAGELRSAHHSLPHRRVLYALEGLAGLRHSEAAGLTSRQYHAVAEVLGRISLERTKRHVPRLIPVHPTLARVLAEWKLAGWECTFGRGHEPEDLIVPARRMTARPSPDSQRTVLGDLEMLGLRPRRGHDLRRTFITLAGVDGARKDLLETVTHGPCGDIVSVYTSFPWSTLCGQVKKLKISLRDGLVLTGEFRCLATGLATANERRAIVGEKERPQRGSHPGIWRLSGCRRSPPRRGDGQERTYGLMARVQAPPRSTNSGCLGRGRTASAIHSGRGP